MVCPCVQAFPAWSSLTTYSQGQTIVYTDGNTYSSLVAGNLNHVPSSSPTQWALQPTLTLQSQAVPIFGNTFLQQPQSSPVLEWTIGNTYSIGSFVMFDAAMWLSIANNNTGNIPDVPSSAFWVAVTNGTFATSTIDLNFANTPIGNAAWNGGTTYAEDALVTGSDNNVYLSTINGNIANNPVGDNNVHWLLIWAINFAIGTGNSQWSQ